MGLFSRLFGHRRRAPEPPPAPKIIKAPTLSPQQIAAQKQLMDFALSTLKDPYKGFEPIAKKTRSQFEKETIPSLAERFTSLGAGGQRSSAFQDALGSSSAELEELLAALQSEYGNQAISSVTGFAGLGMQPQFENIVQQPIMQQRGPSPLSNLLGMGLSAGMMGYGPLGGLLGRGGGISRIFRRF